MRMGNFEGKRGGPLDGGLMIVQCLQAYVNLYPGLLYWKNVGCQYVYRFLFYWAQCVASMRQEEPTALKRKRCIPEYARKIAVIKTQKPFFS